VMMTMKRCVNDSQQAPKQHNHQYPYFPAGLTSGGVCGEAYVFSLLAVQDTYESLSRLRQDRQTQGKREKMRRVSLER
jgi:hypothetical protein